MLVCVLWELALLTLSAMSARAHVRARAVFAGTSRPVGLRVQNAGMMWGCEWIQDRSR